MSLEQGKATPSGNGLYRTDERDAHDSASAAVVDAIATVKDIDPVAGEFCLYDHLDPDALDALVASATDDVTLSITIDGYRVAVDGDCTVTVDGAGISATQ